MALLMSSVFMERENTLLNALPALSPLKPDWSNIPIKGAKVLIASSPFIFKVVKAGDNRENAPKILLSSTPI